MGRQGRVVAWLGWCALCLSSGACSLEERGLHSVVAPRSEGTEPEEPARPGGVGRPDGASPPAPADAGLVDPDDAQATPPAPDAAVVDGAGADLPPPAPDLGTSDDVAAPPVDPPVVAPVSPVTHDRPACLPMIGCGTQTSAGNRLAYAHAVGGGGANRYLVAAVAIGAAGRTVQATFGGASMTEIGTVPNAGGTCQVSLFGLAGPQPGNREITVVVSGAPVGIVLSAASFSNVSQVTPYRLDGYRSAAGTGSQVAVTGPGGPGELAVDAACVTASDGLNVFIPAAPAVEVFDALIGPDKEAVHSLRRTDGAQATATYHVGGTGLDWAAGVVSLRPAR